jgi:hypothetical protein
MTSTFASHKEKAENLERNTSFSIVLGIYRSFSAE